MTRIDAAVATQVVDSTRPNQTSRDQADQLGQAVRQTANGPQGDATPPTAEEVRSAAARLQQVIEAASGRQLNFNFDKKYDELVAVIQDSKTGETIRQIPAKEILKLRSQIDDIVGVMVNKQA